MQEMENMLDQRLILELSTNSPPLTKHFHKYIALYNHIYKEHFKMGVIFESTEKGVVAIYKNLETLINLTKPTVITYPEGDRLEIDFVEKEFLSDYPKEGIHVHFRCYNYPATKVLQILQPFNNQIDPDIITRKNGSDSIVMSFPRKLNAMSFLNYLFATYPIH